MMLVGQFISPSMHFSIVQVFSVLLLNLEKLWQPFQLNHNMKPSCLKLNPELKQENNDACWSIHQPVNAFQLSPNANIFLLLG
jgi:hypothetical protein